MGTGPFGDKANGHFNVQPPVRPLVYWEPFTKRVRVVVRDVTVIDSRRTVAVYETGKLMQLCVPKADLKRGFESGGAFQTLPDNIAALRGHVVIDFDQVDSWFVEDDLGYAHPRDPYHRVDVHRSSQHVVVRAGDTVVAESSSLALLFETSIAPRFYFPPDAIRTGLLEKSETVSQCPYKGDGQHWHVVVGSRRIEDAGWSLTTPMGDALTIPRWFSFYEEKVEIEISNA